MSLHVRARDEAPPLTFPPEDRLTRGDVAGREDAVLAGRAGQHAPGPLPPPVTGERGRHDAAREVFVSPGVRQQDEVGAARVGRRIVEAAIRVDLQHEEPTVRVDAHVAAPVPRAAHPEEERARSLAQRPVELGILDR